MMRSMHVTKHFVHLQCLKPSSGKANWAVTGPSCKQRYGRTEGTIQASFDHTWSFKVKSIIFLHDKQV